MAQKFFCIRHEDVFDENRPLVCFERDVVHFGNDAVQHVGTLAIRARRIGGALAVGVDGDVRNGASETVDDVAADCRCGLVRRGLTDAGNEGAHDLLFEPSEYAEASDEE